VAVRFESQEPYQRLEGTDRDSDHIEPLHQAVVVASRPRIVRVGVWMRVGAVVGEVGGFGEYKFALKTQRDRVGVPSVCL
jgi:hypothetical protein